MHAPKDAPTEILGVIFEQACRCEDPKVCVSEDVPQEVSISHVCQSWRSVALGWPKLWSHYTYRNDKSFIKELDRLTRYLERSRNQPLDLWFILESYDITNNPVLRATRSLYVENRAISLVQKATEHAHRWRRISVDIQGESEENYPDRPQSLLVPLQKIHLPTLETFEVVTSARFARPKLVGTLFDAEAEPPKLSFVRMDPASFVFFTPPQNITTLELDWTSRDIHRTTILLELREVMTSPTLTTLSVIGVPSRVSPPGEYYASVEPRISNLKHLRCSNSIFAHTLFFRIQYPQLELLILKDLSIGHIEWNVPSSNIDDVLPALRRLAFMDCGFSPNADRNFKSLMKLTNKVTHLYVFQGIFRMTRKWRTYSLDDGVLGVCRQYRSTHWRNLVALTVAVHRTYEPDAYYDIEIYRAIAMDGLESCFVRLPAFLAEGYKSLDEKSWSRLKDSGLIETMPDENVEDVVPPWPARSREFQGSGHGSRDPFYTVPIA